jgi:hypothetical protein
MGCNLRWNETEQVGTALVTEALRSHDGRSVHGPAVENLEEVVLDEKDLQSKNLIT